MSREWIVSCIAKAVTKLTILRDGAYSVLPTGALNLLTSVLVRVRQRGNGENRRKQCRHRRGKGVWRSQVKECCEPSPARRRKFSLSVSHGSTVLPTLWFETSPEPRENAFLIFQATLLVLSCDSSHRALIECGYPNITWISRALQGRICLIEKYI